VSALRQVMAIVAKDLLIEWRTRDLLATMGAMGLASVVLFSFAVDFTQVPFSRLGAPVLWLAFTFTGMTGLSRSFAVEKENRCLEGLLLAPVDRSVIYAGKLIGNFLVLLALDAVLLVLCFVMLNVGDGAVKLDAAGAAMLAAVILVNALGFAAAGTLLAFMAQRTRRGDFLLPVLQGVLALPILIAAVVATQRIFDAERPLADAMAPLRISGVFDIAFIAISLIMFDHVVED
jgi:heme exporter protein B